MTSRQGLQARVVRWWEALWFEQVPPHSFALLRITLGAVGLVETLSLTPVATFWALDGLTPVPGGGLGVRGWLVEAGLGQVAGWLLFGGLAAAFASMAVGYRTRWAILLAFLGSVVQQLYWNPLPLSSANGVLRVVLFCLIWAECSGSPSVDAWLARRRGALDTEPGPQAIWPLRLVRVNVALVYCVTGLWKLADVSWRDGSALHYVLRFNLFARFPSPPPESLEWLLTVGTYVTLVWELTFPLLLLHRQTRRLALLLGVALHVGMWISLEIGIFSLVMLAAYLAFLDPHRTARWIPSRFRSGLAVLRPGQSTT